MRHVSLGKCLFVNLLRGSWKVLLTAWLILLLSGADAQVITNLNYEDERLVDVLEDLEDRFDLRLFLRQEWIPEGKRINSSIDSINVRQYLEFLLDETKLGVLPYERGIYILAPRDRLDEELTREYYEVMEQLRYQVVDRTLPMVVVGDSSLLGTSNSNGIRITVVDETGVPLPGAAIYFEGLDLTSSTNDQGVSTVTLPAGVHQMEIRMVGFQPFLSNLSVLSSGGVRIDMFSEVIELDEVVVTEQSIRANITSPQAGLVRLYPKQIQTLPVFLGEADVIKTILTIPGVTSLGEGTPGFYVRGGNIDQNLILQDEGMFYTSSHALGFFSVFNPELIRNVEFFKGNIPARYGGRISSVLNVRLRGTNFSDTRIRGGIGTVTSKISVETPLIKDKLSLLAGGRIAYSDWLLNFVKAPEVKNSSANFNDLNLKLSYRIGEKGVLSASYFSSYDRVQFEEQFGFEWSSRNLSLIWDQNISDRVASEFVFSAGWNENENFDPSGNAQYRIRNGQDNLRVKENISIDLDRHQVNTGVEWINYITNDQALVSGVTGQPERSVSNHDGHELSFYLEDEWEFSDRFSFSGGLRAGYFLSLDTLGNVESDFFNLEPRFSARFSIDAESSIKASYSRLNQYIHLISTTTSALPLDQWLVSDTELLPQGAHNYSLGYFRNFNNTRYEASIEGFYRDILNAVEVRDFADLILNPSIRNEVVQGAGQAYGIELFIKKNRGFLTGSFAYTFSRSLNYIQLGESPAEWFPARIDRPHNLNLVLDLILSKKSRLGVNFVYNSGRPVTAPSASYQLSSVTVPHYEGRNEYRIPDYHRLDLSYTIKRNAIRKRRYQDYITFSLYNVYGRRNAFSVFFRKDEDSAASAYQLSVLGSAFPSITYRFEY